MKQTLIYKYCHVPRPQKAHKAVHLLIMCLFSGFLFKALQKKVFVSIAVKSTLAI